MKKILLAVLILSLVVVANAERCKDITQHKWSKVMLSGDYEFIHSPYYGKVLSYLRKTYPDEMEAGWYLEGGNGWTGNGYFRYCEECGKVQERVGYSKKWTDELGWQVGTPIFVEIEENTIIDTDLSVEEQIKILAKSGEICRVFGHWWWYGTTNNDYDDDGNLSPTQSLIYYSDPKPFRQCKVCHKREIKEIKWQDVDK
jgi:hypothetical protein